MNSRKEYLETLIDQGSAADVIPKSELAEMRVLARTLGVYDTDLGEAFMYLVDVASDMQGLLDRKIVAAKKELSLQDSDK